MKNKFFVIILTSMVFIAVCFLSLKELFSVRDITVEYSVFNEQNVEDVTEILEKYKGQSLLFVDVKKIEEEITADRYLKVMQVKKIYPCEISVSLSERKPCYFYEDLSHETGEYYLFDEEFFVVGKVAEKPLLSSGLTGVSFTDKFSGLKPDFVLKKQIEFGYGFNDMLLKSTVALGDSRNNIVSINFVGMPEAKNYRLVLKTVEGVSIEIRNADRDLFEKVIKGVNFYKSLSESERIENTILVYNESDGIRCDYTKKNAEIIV